MQVSFKSQYIYNYPQSRPAQNRSSFPQLHETGNFELPNFQQCTGIINSFVHSQAPDKAQIRAMCKFLKDENGNFSIHKASQAIKQLADQQMMTYSEEDVKNIIDTVRENNPSVSREKVLKTLAQISSFSNYESLNAVEEYLKKEKINIIYPTKQLTINNVFRYLANTKKSILEVPHPEESIIAKKALFLDRNTLNFLNDLKNTEPDIFNSLKDDILENGTKLVLLDGWEAKTQNGNKSFNIVGAWGDLAEATSDVIKEEQLSGKSPFNDDIISSVNTIFEDDMPVDIIKNRPDFIDERVIANRLNPKGLSEKEIEKAIIATASFTYSPEKLTQRIVEELKDNIAKLKGQRPEERENLEKLLGAKKLIDERKMLLQELISSMLLFTSQIYSPRRIATEMKALHKKLGDRAFYYDKPADNLLFIVPKKDKSFGLINYQYSKVNNIPASHYVYANKEDLTIDVPNKKNKVYVLLDDFSGSGHSMMWELLPYSRFKCVNPNEPIIFSALTYTKKAEESIQNEINHVQGSKFLKDSFVGGIEIKNFNYFSNLLSHRKINLIRNSFDSGYLDGGVSLAFEHVIPDNCTDISGFILESLLRNTKANKAKMNSYKKKLILDSIENSN